MNYWSKLAELRSQRMTTVRVLVCGDTHFKAENAVEIEAFIEKFNVAARRLQPDVIVLLGDTLDSHGRISMQALKMAVDFFKMAASYAPVYALIGNHDRIGNTDFMSDIHPFVGLEGYPNLVIVHKAMSCTIKGRNGAEASFIFVPYVAPGRLVEALDTLELPDLEEEGWRSPSVDIIFAHQEIRGVQMGPIKSTEGDLWDPHWPLLCSGHIHDAQKLQENVLYVGTPYQATYSESPHKAISLFEVNTLTYDDARLLKEVSYDGLVSDKDIRVKYTRISLGLPMKRTIYLPVSELGNFQLKDNEKVKLILSGSTGELKAAQKSRAFTELTKRGVRVALAPQAEAAQKRNLDPERPQQSYLSVFREKVSHNKELRELFDSLFSS